MKIRPIRFGEPFFMIHESVWYKVVWFLPDGSQREESTMYDSLAQAEDSAGRQVCELIGPSTKYIIVEMAPTDK